VTSSAYLGTTSHLFIKLYFIWRFHPQAKEDHPRNALVARYAFSFPACKKGNISALTFWQSYHTLLLCGNASLITVFSILPYTVIGQRYLVCSCNIRELLLWELFDTYTMNWLDWLAIRCRKGSEMRCMIYGQLRLRAFPTWTMVGTHSTASDFSDTTFVVRGKVLQYFPLLNWNFSIHDICRAIWSTRSSGIILIHISFFFPFPSSSNKALLG